MCPQQVVIVHGWSDDSDSFKPLASFLKKHGYDTVTIWLADYISLDDDVRIEDVAKRMDQVLSEKLENGSLAAPFDMIVHSTGGLVARQWVSTYGQKGGPTSCPLKRLIMLAPANYGSKLASMGQSMLGRIVKGWKNWFHTGKEMLNALELASPFQWELARRDLFTPEAETAAHSPYGADRVMPFVITGSHPYPDGLRKIVNENGSDGTVRVAAANLNVHGMTIDFASNEDDPKFIPWKKRHSDELRFPFAVLPDRSHGSIIEPLDGDIKSAQPYRDRLGELILSALRCKSKVQYNELSMEWDQISEETAALATDQKKLSDVFLGQLPAPEFFHQYMQIVVRVEDDHGEEVRDFFLEFFSPKAKGDREAIYFHHDVLEDVHVNRQTGALRSLFIDRTDLMTNFYDLIPNTMNKQVAMSISANPPGENISYFVKSEVGASGYLIVHSYDDGERKLHRNCTHLVKIVIPRTPKAGVFKLRRG